MPNWVMKRAFANSCYVQGHRHVCAVPWCNSWAPCGGPAACWRGQWDWMHENLRCGHSWPCCFRGALKRSMVWISVVVLVLCRLPSPLSRFSGLANESENDTFFCPPITATVAQLVKLFLPLIQFWLCYFVFCADAWWDVLQLSLLYMCLCTNPWLCLQINKFKKKLWYNRQCLTGLKTSTN